MVKLQLWERLFSSLSLFVIGSWTVYISFWKRLLVSFTFFKLVWRCLLFWKWNTFNLQFFFLYSENSVCASLGFLLSCLKQQVLAAGKPREPLCIHWSEKEGSAGAEEVTPPPPNPCLSRQVFQGQRSLNSQVCWTSSMLYFCLTEWSLL